MSFKYDVTKDGITQSLLGTFQQCRYKARFSCQGWSSKYESMGLTYGTIGHAVLEKAYTDIQMKHARVVPSKPIIHRYIAEVEAAWKKDHPRADKRSLEYLELSCLIAEATLPLYFEYWVKDLKDMRWISLEHEFKIPYTTSTGVHTFLRGKMDGVFDSSKKVWLFESKFKSRLDEEDLMDTLGSDFQAMFYLYALIQIKRINPAGFLYNIVRRIGLKQKEKETVTQFAQRCIEDIIARPEFYFIRREVMVNDEQMQTFQHELDALICDFVDWCMGKGRHYPNRNSCVDKYGRCTYLDICSGHGFSSYVKRESMFRELGEQL